jgi:hypothetical protein
LVLANVRSSDEFLEFLAVLYFRRRVRHICPKKIFLVILLPHLRPQSSRISALEENPIIINIKTKTFPDDFKDNFAAVDREARVDYWTAKFDEASAVFESHKKHGNISYDSYHPDDHVIHQ